MHSVKTTKKKSNARIRDFDQDVVLQMLMPHFQMQRIHHVFIVFLPIA